MGQMGILGKRSFLLDLFPFFTIPPSIVIFFATTLDGICIFMFSK